MAIFASPGFNVEIVEYKNVSFTVWDVGGQDKVSISINRLFHILFYRYDPFGDTNFRTLMALFLWRVENDRERISEARDELHRMLSEVIISMNFVNSLQVCSLGIILIENLMEMSFRVLS